MQRSQVNKHELLHRALVCVPVKGGCRVWNRGHGCSNRANAVARGFLAACRGVSRGVDMEDAEEVVCAMQKRAREGSVPAQLALADRGVSSPRASDRVGLELTEAPRRP